MKISAEELKHIRESIDSGMFSKDLVLNLLQDIFVANMEETNSRFNEDSTLADCKNLSDAFELGKLTTVHAIISTIALIPDSEKDRKEILEVFDMFTAIQESKEAVKQ